MATEQRELRCLPVITGFFVAVLVLTPPLDAKFIALGPFVAPGATLLFPVSFILNDVLTEVYGYGRSRRVIWTGMACQVLAAASFWLVGVLPSAPFWRHQEAYSTILGIVPRIALASLLAYLTGEFANSFVLSRMKYSQRGRTGLEQGWRFLASTLVGEALDSVVFMAIAFLGVLTTRELLATMLTIYLIKVGIEIIALPGSTRLANWLKRVEAFDQLDDPAATRYNPFKLGVSGIA
jgi:queuosine precursor transporter